MWLDTRKHHISTLRDLPIGCSRTGNSGLGEGCVKDEADLVFGLLALIYAAHLLAEHVVRLYQTTVVAQRQIRPRSSLIKI